jgi:hypothetical protein
VLAIALIVVFTIVGIWFGTPEPTTQETFTGVLRRFGTDSKTRTILAFILVDVVTGVMAAMRLGTFDGQRLAAFYMSNVIPYLLGYLLVWILVLLGLDTLLPQTVQTGIASFGFAMITTALSYSVLNNLQRMGFAASTNTRG